MKPYYRQEKLMGSAFELCVVDRNEKNAKHLLEIGVQEIKRLEELLTEFKPTSETSRINSNASKLPVEITKESHELIRRSLSISKLSDGDFDITVGPLKKLYNFKKGNFKLPSRSLVNQTLKRIGYRKISLSSENHTISYNGHDLQISFAAIGKGYASDRVKKIWLENGVKAGFINASGDLNSFGRKPDGSVWNVGIAHPDIQGEILMYVPVDNASVATSGDYEQFFIHEGQRYSHNINPHTGWPLQGIKSVTVFSPSAELSDALATAVYVKGVEAGIEFIDQLPQTHAIIIDENNDLFFSKEMQYEEVGA